MAALIEARMAAVRELAHAQQAVADAETALAAARAQHKKAWARAIARGFTEAELRKTGLTKPAPTRTRRAHGPGATHSAPPSDT